MVRFAWDHSSSLSRSIWMASLPFVVPPAPLSVVSDRAEAAFDPTVCVTDKDVAEHCSEDEPPHKHHTAAQRFRHATGSGPERKPEKEPEKEPRGKPEKAGLGGTSPVTPGELTCGVWG